jgi:hypothetical protein
MKGQCTCIKFYCRLGTVASEMNEMLKTAFGVNAMGRMQTVEWFSRLISGETLAEVCERLDHLCTGHTNKHIEKFCKIINNGRWSTISDIAGRLGLLYGTCH